MIHFVLGGAKSGKSRYAEKLLMKQAAPWYYLATGRPWDDEMRQKIMIHQQRRGISWKTLEVPVNLVSALNGLGHCLPVLIDCMTLWLTNLMMEQRDIRQETDHLVQVLGDYTGHVVIVSNEVGQGIVPDNQMARQFVNEAGVMHQKIAAIADRFIVMQAGYPLIIKSGKDNVNG